MQSERKVLIYLLNAYAFVARVPNIIKLEKNILNMSYQKELITIDYCLHYIFLFRLHSKYFKVYFRSVILTSITNNTI